MLRCEELEDQMTAREAGAWKTIREVLQNFFGNKRKKNCKALVNNLIEEYKKMGCRMSLKLHFLHSHLDFFGPNMESVSKEYGKRLHHDISNVERRQQGRWSCNMMGNYVWCLNTIALSVRRRKSRKQHHF